MCVDRCKVAMNKKLERIEEYKPSQRTYETNVSKLDWNECNLEFNEEFQKILLSSLSEISLSEYPNIYNSELLDLLADYCDVFRENVQVFNGSDSALHYIFAAFLNPETKVLGSGIGLVCWGGSRFSPIIPPSRPRTFSIKAPRVPSKI